MYNLIVDEYVINNANKFNNIAENLSEDYLYNKLYNDKYGNYNY